MDISVLRLIPAATLGALLASCVSGPVASHNLDELLDSNDQLRHVIELRGFKDQLLLDLTGRIAVIGATVAIAASLDDDDVNAIDGELLGALYEGTVEVAGGAGQILDQLGSDQTGLVHVGDPSLEALHQLLDLISVPVESLADELRLIRQLTRYAAQCPGRLARERAILGLGPWLVKLEVKVPMDPPRVPAEAEDLTRLIGRFYSDWKVAPDNGTDELQASVDALLDTEINIQGMWRVLKGLEALASQDRATPAMGSILIQLARSLEARSLAMALASGLTDVDPIVRAAAIETGMGYLDSSFILEALECLVPGQVVDDQGRVPRTRNHGLFPIVPGEGLVVQRLLDQLALGGLRLPEDLDPAARNSLRRSVLGLVIEISHDVVTFDEASRAAALRALVALAPEGPGSRRKEDWEGWWREFAQQAQGAATAEAAEDAPTDG
ncbi:MAG: hypothetical protein OSB42_11900 [Planctomycetota bacterium]|nr:hypothetical protein [Planctomycetota bacterium]